MNIKNKKTNDGYVILISTLIIGAIGAAIALSLLLSGLATSRTGSVIEKSIQARGLANACAEEALQLIRETTSFTGSGNVIFGSDSCDYTVTSQTEENRTIRASATVDTITRRVIVSITQINPSITIASWQEVADF